MIKHHENKKKGEFVLLRDGVEVGKMTYSKTGQSKIIIDHTEVKEPFRNTGAGRELVEYGVEWARNNNLKVLPLCPFAKNLIERDPDLQDVLS
ncbi:GNAT family N-acetyltransferase [Rhodohalobacter sp. 8-1]|uniref:GNAT family N-acetyltransferase n=1 Tax=Rhodohalobacter sp. 8-1 TaxID=3131972 RepID=UPI0030EBC456